MDKKNFNFFRFVYEIIRFIFLLPINLIRYFCLGFYYICSIFIELVLNFIIFMSYVLYKVIKYFILFFSFPIVLYNLLSKPNTRKKIHKRTENEALNLDLGDKQKEIDVSDLKEQNVYVERVDPIVNIDEMLAQTSIEEELNDLVEKNIQPIYEDGYTDLDNFENIDVKEEIVEEVKLDNISERKSDNVKITTPPKHSSHISLSAGLKKILKVPMLLGYGLSYPVYKLFKYFIFGIGSVVLIIGKLFLYACVGVYRTFRCITIYPSFVVYKIFKYLLLSLSWPVMLMNIIARRNESNGKKQTKEELRLKRQEEKFKRQLEAQKRKEEKVRLSLEQKKKREKENEEYINENAKLEKKTFKEKFNESLNKLFSLPNVLVNKIKNSYENSVFVKNARNRRDMNRQALLINFEGEDAEKSDVKLVYEYTAKNKDGKVVKDYFEAFSKVEVHSYLLSEGYEVYNIRTSKWIQFAHGKASVSKTKIKNKDLIFFLNQLSTYIKAGIPLVEALRILARQYNRNKAYQRLFSSVIYDLTMGESFSTALSKQGDAFPRILINMVKASEMTGELPEVLDDMSAYFTEMDKTRKQMVTALMYPIIILVISVAVVIFILLFVIPRFVTIYETMDAAEIPKFTLMVLAVSDFLKNYVFHLLIGITVVVVVFIYLFKNVKAFRTVVQWFAMHLPVFGNVIIYNEVTTFTKTFASLLAHNVFITDSMEILNKVTNNEIYKMLILDTITNLAKGEKISESFKGHWAFPIPAYEMLVTGERTGQLPEMMAKVSEYYQEMHRNAVARIKTFIEPVLILFLTAIVGVIVLAIVIPMFGMYQSVQGYS